MGASQTHADETARNDAFLRNSAEPVRAHLAASVELSDFLRDAGSLTLAERRLLVAQALVLLEQNYVHLPLKIAMHGINPLQRLRLLGAQLEGQSASTIDPEWMFHAELSAVFHSLHDLHTSYILPEPFAGKIAYLPFQVEEFFAKGDSHFVISRLAEGYSAPGLEPGAEVMAWNGIPIGRAVDLNAARFAGSNAAARHARGLESLTIRSLHVDLPPDEHWVTVGFTANDGSSRELRQAWLVVDNLPAFGPDPDQESDGASLGLDFGGDATARATKLLFAPGVVAREDAEREGRAPPRPQAPDTVVDTPMPGLFRASAVTTPSGTYGHLRIFTFRVPNPRAFVDEFVRLLAELPQDGLILDVRGNPGGTIQAGELALQALTPRRIVPEPVQFINTPLNLLICRRHRMNPTGAMDLGPWFPSIEQALATGATFSQAFPITAGDEANAMGQVYHGPVVLITDARCYSAGDIFAAGFQDHAIGPVLGVDDNTGAGGANVWSHGRLMSAARRAQARRGLAVPGAAQRGEHVRRDAPVAAGGAGGGQSSRGSWCRARRPPPDDPRGRARGQRGSARAGRGAARAHAGPQAGRDDHAPGKANPGGHPPGRQRRPRGHLRRRSPASIRRCERRQRVGHRDRGDQAQAPAGGRVQRRGAGRHTPCRALRPSGRSPASAGPRRARSKAIGDALPTTESLEAGMQRLKMSPAMGVALVALFVALGGTGYAVVTLPKNSVGTKQLVNGAVTTKKIKARAVHGGEAPQLPDRRPVSVAAGKGATSGACRRGNQRSTRQRCVDPRRVGVRLVPPERACRVRHRLCDLGVSDRDHQLAGSGHHRDQRRRCRYRS